MILEENVLGASSGVVTPDPFFYPTPIIIQCRVPGVSSDEVTPDPISNSEVKIISADGSLRARVGRCQELCIE